jgi:hypothetical protein
MDISDLLTLGMSPNNPLHSGVMQERGDEDYLLTLVFGHKEGLIHLFRRLVACTNDSEPVISQSGYCFRVSICLVLVLAKLSIAHN